MELVNIKVEIRKILDFLLTSIFLRNIKLMFFLIKAGGASSYIENQFLFKCASRGDGNGLIVEIGSYAGRSTISLALGSKSKRREKVYAIDPLEDLKIREAFIKNIRWTGLKDYIIVNYKKSEEVAKEFNFDIRILFIDGSHKYEDVKKDILLWRKYLIDGGIIAIHDYLPQDHPCYLDDVRKAVDEFIINSGDFIVEGRIDSILFASKKKSANKEIFIFFNKFNKIREYLRYFIDRTYFKC